MTVTAVQLKEVGMTTLWLPCLQSNNSIRTLTKTAQRYWLEDSPLATCMMIDMNGPDIEAVDEVKALVLESVNAWTNYKKRMPSSADVTRPSKSAQGRSNVVKCLLSTLGT